MASRASTWTVTLVSLKRMENLHDSTVSCARRARTWGAGVGTYRAGQTWVEPAFADDIASKNASNDEPARALVVLVTSDDAPPESRLSNRVTLGWSYDRPCSMA